MRKVIRVILFLPYILIVSCLILNYVAKYNNEVYQKILPLLSESIGYGALYNIWILIAAFYYRMCPYFKSAITGLLLMNILGIVNYFYPMGNIRDTYEITILSVSFLVTSFYIIRKLTPKL